VISGVLFGGFMGPFTAWQTRRMRSATGEASTDEVLLASRAVLRGPVPIDPELRATTHRLATHRLAQLERWRVFTTVVFVLAVIGEAFAAVAISPWFWLAVAFFAGMLTYSVWLPARLRRRIELLGPDAC
jgi:hypothetical protein